MLAVALDSSQSQRLGTWHGKPQTESQGAVPAPTPHLFSRQPVRARTPPPNLDSGRGRALPLAGLKRKQVTSAADMEQAMIKRTKLADVPRPHAVAHMHSPQIKLSQEERLRQQELQKRRREQLQVDLKSGDVSILHRLLQSRPPLNPEEKKMCLKALDSVDMTLELLSSTKVGLTVNQLRASASSDDDIKQLATRLIVKWKHVAEGKRQDDVFHASLGILERAPILFHSPATSSAEDQILKALTDLGSYPATIGLLAKTKAGFLVSHLAKSHPSTRVRVAAGKLVAQCRRFAQYSISL